MSGAFPPFMTHRNLLIGLIALLPTLACGGSTQTECSNTPSTQSDKTTGGYTYTASPGSGGGAGNGAAGAAGSAGAGGCVAVSRGEVGASNPVVIAPKGAGSIDVSGQYEDASGRAHFFVASVTGLSGPKQASADGGGGNLCVDGETCAPITWTADMTTLSLVCPDDYSHKGCLLDAAGNLTVTGRAGGWTLTLELTLDRHDEWHESCTTRQYGSS